jgi:hypothetical protein
MNYYLDKLNVSLGEVKDYFSLAIKIEGCNLFLLVGR